MVKSETKHILNNNDISILSSEGVEYNLYLGEFTDFNQVSVQIDWSDLNALDAVLQLQQRNCKTMKWNNIPTLIYTMDIANDSVVLENYEFCGKDLNLNIKWNNVSSGKISVFVVMKKK